MVMWSPHLFRANFYVLWCEEQKLWRSQTGQVSLALAAKPIASYSDAGTGELDVLTTHETLSMKMAIQSIGDAGSDRPG